jgi:hypothetical protein
MIARVASGTPNKSQSELSGKEFDELMAEWVKKGYKVHTTHIVSMEKQAVSVFILWEMAKA